MKLNITLRNTYIFLFSLLILFSCNDDYLIDTGVHDPNFDGSIMAYLESNPEYFGLLVQALDLAELSGVLENDTITFFAPTDQTIQKSIEMLNGYLYFTGNDSISRLDQIDPKVWREILSLYIIEDSYLLKDIPQLDTTQLDAYGGQGFISFGGVPMNVGVVYSDAGGVKYAGYRQLYYSYITDFGGISRNAMINAPVASCNIQPNNGVVHVLRFRDHFLGFRRSDFVLKALSEGITY